TDYAPLGASFSNTWEAGYKGFLGQRLSLALDVWSQKRPADPTTQIINPGVPFNPQQLGPFLGHGIAQALIAARTPPGQAAATARYYNQPHAYSDEVRGRYADAFTGNSGVFNSYNIGTPVPYPPVPVNALLDAGFSWVIPVNGAPRWSLNATNLLDNKVPTFVGVPAIGRMIMTRLQYQF